MWHLILCYYSLMLDYHNSLFKSASNTTYRLLGETLKIHIQKFEVTDDLGKGSKSIVHSVQLQNKSY